ncbi:MAG: AI-2E family transporter [Desulfobacteraceae bacterium]|nr:AI-2E family transporter [Desulfobacteraceae bacterium]
MKREIINKSVLILVVIFISALFLSMIRSFLMAIFLAGLFSALMYPLFRRFKTWYKGRTSLASLSTLLLVIVFILLPLTGLMGIVTTQAIKVGKSIKPWVQHQIAEPGELVSRLKTIPFADQILPYREPILQKAGELVGVITNLLVNGLQAAAIETVNFIFMAFVLLYTMYFFLIDGKDLIVKILHYLPLEDHDEQRILERFTSVTRATLKGTAVIGVLQGGLAGLAMAVVGIPSALFWTVIMIVLSIIPGIGTVLIWLPAAVILAISGHLAKGVLLAVFCGVVVGSVDNLLRPRLVGKDTQMHELLIFFGTLGGILMFGIVGFIIGPIIAALFTTIWDIYAVSFNDVLPAVKLFSPDPSPDTSGPEPVESAEGQDEDHSPK